MQYLYIHTHTHRNFLCISQKRDIAEPIIFFTFNAQLASFHRSDSPFEQCPHIQASFFSPQQQYYQKLWIFWSRRFGWLSNLHFKQPLLLILSQVVLFGGGGKILVPPWPANHNLNFISVDFLTCVFFLIQLNKYLGKKHNLRKADANRERAIFIHLFYCSSIHLLNTCISSVYCGLTPLLDVGDSNGDKTGFLPSQGSQSSVENRQVNKSLSAIEVFRARSLRDNRRNPNPNLESLEIWSCDLGSCFVHCELRSK